VYPKGDPLAFHSKIPAGQSSQAGRRNTKDYFGYITSEGAQGSTNGMMGLSVIEFPKIDTRRSTSSDDDNDVVDDGESPCAKTKSWRQLHSIIQSRWLAF